MMMELHLQNHISSSNKKKNLEKKTSSTSTLCRSRESNISFIIFCIFFLIFPPRVDGSISIIESGTTFHSKPDRNIGQQLIRGYEYMGRLQTVRDNPTLCPRENRYEKFNIVPSSDGLPVALIAQSGGCSLMEKAAVAGRMIHPSNQVQYLIVQDSSKRHKGQLGEKYDDDNDNEQKWPFIRSSLNGASSLVSDFSSGDEIFDEDGDYDESNYISVDFLGEQHRLEQLLDINLAVLHVSYYNGQILLNMIDTENPLVTREGGTRVLLNSKEWNVSTRTVVIWMLVTLMVCACSCCCIIAFVQSSFEEDQQQQQAPRRPTRRRLTLEQVRSRFPAFHFNSIEHHQNHSSPNCEDDTESQQNRYCQLSDECTICLDEFIPGVRCRKLPCEHTFHSTCIARWLIERSAVCPLCKLDLYEEEVIEDENDEESEPVSPSHSHSFFSWWSDFSRSSVENSTNNNESRQIEIPYGNQQSTEERSALIAAITATENTTTTLEVARSWWPFSVESSVPDTEEEMHGDDDENDDNIHRSTSTSGFWNGLFGHIRRPHRRSPTDNDMLTELTEPLVSSVEQRLEEDVDSSTRRSEETNLPRNSTTSEI